MNLAILIAVSEYQNYDDLKACEKDANAIESILKSDKKYEHVLRITKDTKAQQIKSQLTEFIQSHNSVSVDELFFYYSGHGEYFENEFYFIPTDFDKSKRKQTALENTELDQLIRSLSPKLTVKIVDACQSGVRYVKDTDSFTRHLKSTGTEYEKCYFMFSSYSDQSSFQDNELSLFTRSIVTAVSEHQEPDIRYKDIVDSVSDQFQDQDEQTPFFVIQADYTEKFILIDQTLKAKLTTLLPVVGSTQLPDQTERRKEPLYDLVNSESKSYFTEQEAISSLERIVQAAKLYKISDELKDLYNFDVKTEGSIEYLEGCGTIGRWLQKNANTYFAKPVTDIVTVRKRSLNTSMLTFSTKDLLNPAYKYEDVEEEQAVGLEFTLKMPFEYISVCAEPKLPSLKYYECHLVPIISKTETRLFRRFCAYKDDNWNTRSVETFEKWAMLVCGHMQLEDIESKIKSEMDKFEKYILHPLVKKYYGSTDEDANDDSK